MIDYAEASDCRTTTLLRYFGEQRDTRCGRCDACDLVGQSVIRRVGGPEKKRARP
jgi:superfamily II DNA helicase RecQ